MGASVTWATHVVLLMMYEGLVSSVESGRATLQMTDGPGKVIGKSFGLIGIVLGRVEME